MFVPGQIQLRILPFTPKGLEPMLHTSVALEKYSGKNKVATIMPGLYKTSLGLQKISLRLLVPTFCYHAINHHKRRTG
jgi:hypothetical protein